LANVADADVALRVGIPQLVRAESLNAAVAGSIVLYEIARAAGILQNIARTSDP
jgi:tRNA G18 (ribose-2'-O)-methylase SpoU